MFWTRKKKDQSEKSEVSDRIPAGQHLTKKWPVLHVGSVPNVTPATWSFETSGLVENPLRFSWDEFSDLPMVEITTDFHCVTTWSKLDMTWRGVPIAEILRRTGVRPEAHFVMAHAEGGYTTNIPLEVLNDDDVLLAVACDGEPLTPEHGAPMRLVVPKRYAWKSAKWLRGMEFMEDDQPGFWEMRGYHNNADPWKEERFG